MGCTGKPWVLSGYKSMLGVAGGTRPGMHAGVDFSGKRGDPILAAADGVVNWVEFSGGCGNGVIIYHEKFNKSTVYCHMEKTIVNYGQVIKRGEIIGYIGTTGKSMGIPHSHFEVSLDRFSHASGDVENTEDPFKYIDGCYDPKKNIPHPSSFSLIQ